jgi:MoaA/NifB/PqqE/SkfB family radical SAM enzyme
MNKIIEYLKRIKILKDIFLELDSIKNKISLIILRRFYFRLKMAYPRCIAFETTNVCNLRCPICPTGSNLRKIPSKILTYEEFKCIADKLSDSITSCYLFDWGEELLNPDIFKIIKYFKSRGVKLFVSSNFSFDKEDVFFEQIIDSRLDELIISLDGASQETYSKYRIGGDFNKVIRNIDKLRTLQIERSVDVPKITWKFIVNKFNESEIGQARKLARSMGIEFVLAGMNLGDLWPDIQGDSEESIEDRIEYWLPKNKRLRNRYYRDQYRLPLNNFLCDELFLSCTIGCDGKVYPCCYCADQKSSFGDLQKQSFEEIWNNFLYQYSRSLFIKDIYNGKVVQTICQRCVNYRKYKN